METDLIIILKQALDDLGNPTEGKTAEMIWRWLSSMHGPKPSTARAIYRQLGYEPFEGYPLVRKKPA